MKAQEGYTIYVLLIISVGLRQFDFYLVRLAFRFTPYVNIISQSVS